MMETQYINKYTIYHDVFTFYFNMQHETMILSPKLISIDTFQISQMANDLASGDQARIEKSKDFEKRLIDSGYYIFLTFHHITELIDLKYRSEKLLRINFLRNIPCVAWISSNYSSGAGSELDLFRIELKEILSTGHSDFDVIRKSVREKYINYGNGESAITEFSEYWDEIGEHISESSHRSREIVGISRSNFVDISQTKLSNWIEGKIRTVDQTNEILNELEIKLLVDLEARGDNRLKDRQATAKEFFQSIRSEYKSFVTVKSEPIRAYLKNLGLTDKDIQTPKMTMDEIGDLAVFRKQVSLATRYFSTKEKLKSLSLYPNQIPSKIVTNSLKKYGQSQPEWKGSELNDRSFAAFAPYIDICCVDKRTHQDYISAARKVPNLREMNLKFVKYSNYGKIEI